MKKKIISLLLVATLSSSALISCGKTEPSGNTNKEATPTEQTSSKSSTSENSNITGDNNKPTIEVKAIAKISDFKDKSKDDIEKLLGSSVNQADTKSTYEKDNFTLEITYLNSKCNEIKIIPKIEMKYPADGSNILNIVGISAGEADNISPAGLEWNDKYDTFKINVVSNNQLEGKISYANIILSEPAK